MHDSWLQQCSAIAIVLLIGPGVLGPYNMDVHDDFIYVSCCVGIVALIAAAGRQWCQ